MTHDIIGQQLDEALRLVEPAEEAGKRRGYLRYRAEQIFREFIEEYGPELAPYKLSEILENEKQRVHQ